MSETALTKQSEHPGTAQPKAGVNMRKAEAGLIKLRNPTWSMRRCAEEAGYSKSSALRLDGLSESLCVAEAWKLYPDPKPAKILRKARTLLDLKLNDALAHPDKLTLAAITRTLDTVERAYTHASATDSPEADARSFSDRCRWVAELFNEMQKRGLEPPSSSSS